MTNCSGFGLGDKVKSTKGEGHILFPMRERRDVFYYGGVGRSNRRTSSNWSSGYSWGYHFKK